MTIENDDITAFLKKLFPRRTFFIYFLPNAHKWSVQYDKDLGTRDARKLMSETKERFPGQDFAFGRIPF